ncbi:hypothetical protein, partial [Klebsiella pneumoniae]|uniref:hypothetical protein n=1 Tax=Klebsiella pneumoniae TaxID=573 RepID=UPI00272EF2EE
TNSSWLRSPLAYGTSQSSAALSEVPLTVSLLDAALHNFDYNETQDNAYEPASTYISQPYSAGQFDTLPAIRQVISITAFTR